VPFYPQPAIIGLVAAPAFVSLLWPFGGGILTLALLAPPIFAFGTGWGVVYVVLATLSMAVFKRKDLEWAALLPGTVPFAVLGGLGLALMPLTGALMRRWGALSGFLSGLVLTITAGLTNWTWLPFAFNPAPGPFLSEAHYTLSPWTVLTWMARFLDARPELALQILFFTLFSVPLYVLPGSSLRRRAWGVSGYLMAVFAAFVLVPILALEVPVHVGLFLAAYGPCAIISFLCAFLISSDGTRLA
jgi:hypothetical protein